MESTRYEVKMTCAEMHLPQVRGWVRLHPDAFAQAYPPRQVNNLYFDTREMDCLNDNLMGISERIKLRFRWYGQNHSVAQGVLELKHKTNQLGWKESCPVPVPLDLTTISWIDLMRQMRQHAVGDVAVWLSADNQPVLINSYIREYYESIDHQVRVTVDYDQVVCEQITYAAPNLVSKSFIEDQIVIEVKVDSRLHRRLSNVLYSFPLQTGRNSKYVNGVIDSLCFL